MLDTISGSLVVAAFGIPVWPEDHDKSVENRTAAVTRLINGLGLNVIVAFGDRDGYFGNIGGKRRLSYSFVVPESGGCLAALIKLDYGQSAEIGEPVRIR